MEYRRLGEDEFRDLESRILYEDNHILVFNKRPGEIVQADKTGDECLAETLKAFIAQRDDKPGKVYVGIPHRLDPACQWYNNPRQDLESPFQTLRDVPVREYSQDVLGIVLRRA